MLRLLKVFCLIGKLVKQIKDNSICHRCGGIKHNSKPRDLTNGKDKK